MTRRALPLSGAVVLLAAAVAGCTRSHEQPDHPLSGALVSTVSAGYEVVRGPASGPMDLKSATESTPADPGAKRRLLRRSGYQDGYSRVWRNGEGDYVTALGHEFSSADGARALVAFEVEQAREKQGTQPFSVPEIPGAAGYLLSGTTRRDSRPVFCQSVWFAHGTRAYNVTTCGGQPGSPDDVRAIAAKQYAEARSS